MNKIRFSVIVSAYNIEKYIERALESILCQDFKNYEVLLVDDCSTDNTFEIINKYKSGKIGVYQTKSNSGTAGATRNIGIENAKGEFLIFLDGDDTIYDSQTLSKIDEAIGNDYPDVVFLGYEDAGQDNKQRISTKENSTKEARIMCDLTFSVSSRCWNREFLIKNELKFIEGMYYEDEIFSMKTNIIAQNTKYADIKVFKYYRNREGSVMTKPTIKKCSDFYRMLAEIVDLYQLTPEEYKTYLLSFIVNENESIPIRIKAILEAFKNNENIKTFPKREYKYRRLIESENQDIYSKTY